MTETKKRRIEFNPRMGMKKNDLYETPGTSLDKILCCLDPRVHYIWEPFVGTGHSTRYMREKGFQVTSGSHPDFFQQHTIPTAPEGMVVVLVSNPPFSLKKEIMKRVEELGLERLALLIPAAALFTNYFQEFKRYKDVQMVVHTRRCSFLDPDSGKPNPPAPFEVAWFCFGLNLPRDIYFPE